MQSMVQAMSCFSQVISLIDRQRFAEAVFALEAERSAKGFRCWDQLVAMLRFNLLTYRDVWRWLDAPFAVLDTGPPHEQLWLVT